MAPPLLDSSNIRKLKPKIFDEFRFSSFLGISGNQFDGKFKENVISFLQQCGEIQDYEVVNSTIHRIKVRGPEEGWFPLYAIEETVQESPIPSCCYCESCGWGRLCVSKSKHHFVVPERDRWDMRLDDNFLKHPNHILYGLIHSNGYGHLISVNGVRGAPYSPIQKITEFPCQDQAMSIWDCLCSLLQPRSIIVRDVMDVKLLHILAFGQPWYAKWGYKFDKGCYGLSKTKYEDAVRVLSNLAIEAFETDCSLEIRQIIEKNRRLSKLSLTSVSDLLQFILAFEAKVSMNIQSISAALAKSNKRLRGQIKYILVSIACVMKHKKDAKIDKLTKQELLEEMTKYPIDRRLSDFVLDNVSLFRMEDHVIHCSTNSSTEVQELKIQEIPQDLKAFPITQEDQLVDRIVLGESLNKDILDFHRAVRSVYRGIDPVSLAIKAVLDSRHFVKKWPIQEPDSSPSTERLCKNLLKTMWKHFDAEEIGELDLPEWLQLDLAEEEFHKFNVYCTCGTIYDDGERMAMCSVCQVIHHTRCSGIDDKADVPVEFLCVHCKNQKEEVGMEMNDKVGLKMNDNV